MAGIGIVELVVVAGIGLLGMAGMVGLFFVIWAVVRSGNRDAEEKK